MASNNNQKETAYSDQFAASELPLLQRLKAFPRFVPRPHQASYIFKWEVFKRVLNVQGSIVELGVYLGAGLFAFANFSSMLEPYNYQRRIIGFDTFAGFPELSAQDTNSGTASDLRKPGGFSVPPGHFAELQQSVELYDANRYLSQREKIELIKGNVINTIPEYLEAHPHTLISLLYLDLDLYEPTVFALKQLWPRVVPGGIVVFDEANDPRWPGETIALLDQFGCVPAKLERLPFEPSASFLIKGI